MLHQNGAKFVATWEIAMSGMEREDRLAVIMLAFACARDVAESIDRNAHYLSHDAQTTIMWHGEEAQHACLLLAGKAQAVSYSAAGQLILLYSYSAGDIFGESAALGSLQDSSDTEIIAVTTSDVGHFRNHVFIGLIESYSAVALAVTRRLTQRLTQTTQRMIEASTLSAVGRIHAELLRQARQGEGLTIQPAPILSEFALLVQSTRETVSRTINQLEKRGIIRRDAQGLTIIAPHRVEEQIF
jgi:CRP/FNR family transcriptional regulator, cyclic AMP receptor protein